MRISILAAGILAIAAPATAQTSFPEEMDRDIARSIPHPDEIEDAAGGVDRVLGAVLNVPVGELVNAVDPRAREHPDATIGDMGSRDDPYFEERMRYSVYEATDEIGHAAARASVIAPLLRRSLADLERSIAVATRDYDRRYR